jgi:hypothetical protein
MEQNHHPDNFKKVEGSDFLHPFEFETKLKIHAEIKARNLWFPLLFSSSQVFMKKSSNDTLFCSKRGIH